MVHQASATALDALARLIPPRDGATIRAHFVEADLDQDFSRIASGTSNVVVALDILVHVFDVFAFVSHCRRMLDAHGALLLHVPNVAYAKYRLELLAGQLPITASWFGRPGDFAAWRATYGWDCGHLHYFTLKTLRGLLRDAGLDVADSGARFERVRRFAPPLLCGNLFIVAHPLPGATGWQ